MGKNRVSITANLLKQLQDATFTQQAHYQILQIIASKSEDQREKAILKATQIVEASDSEEEALNRIRQALA